MGRLGDGKIQIVEVTTEVPSPFAASLLFGYVAEFMYETDAPLAERRASVLSLDSGLLSDLLGQVDIGELLDPDVIERVGGELQRLLPDYHAKGVEGVVDLLRELGPLSAGEIAPRLADGSADAEAHLAMLEAERRVIRVRIGGDQRWAAVEDAARLRDALGVALPAAIPDIFLEPTAEPLRDLVGRHARTHTPFSTGEIAARFGLGVAVADIALERLREQGKVLKGRFGVERRLQAKEPSGIGSNPLAQHEWVGDEVFRRLRLRSLQAAREATRPVPREAYARLLLERHGLLAESAGHAALHTTSPAGGAIAGIDGVARVVQQLAGVLLPASLWESQILQARVSDYTPGMLDELIATGAVIWSGHGRLGEEDGLVALHLQQFSAETLADVPAAAMLDIFADGGAYFVRQIVSLVQARHPGIGGQGTASISSSDPECQTPALCAGLSRLGTDLRISR